MTEEKAFHFKLRFALITAIILSFVIAILLVSTLEDMSFDSSKDSCVERKFSYCPPGMICASCLSVFLHEFPECCADWVERNNTENYASCYEDIMLLHSNDVVNLTDFDKMLDYCLAWDRQTFLDKLQNLTTEYENNK